MNKDIRLFSKQQQSVLPKNKIKIRTYYTVHVITCKDSKRKQRRVHLTVRRESLPDLTDREFCKPRLSTNSLPTDDYQYRRMRELATTMPSQLKQTNSLDIDMNRDLGMYSYILFISIYSRFVMFFFVQIKIINYVLLLYN